MIAQRPAPSPHKNPPYYQKKPQNSNYAPPAARHPTRKLESVPNILRLIVGAHPFSKLFYAVFAKLTINLYKRWLFILPSSPILHGMCPFPISCSQLL